jgi:hypothetical protein
MIDLWRGVPAMGRLIQPSPGVGARGRIRVQQLDPLDSVLGVLFEDDSSDYIREVLSKAGVRTDFVLSNDESYSHRTRKRAYRDRLGPILARFDDSARHRIAENIANQLAGGHEGVVRRLREALAGVGWALQRNRLLPVASAKAPRKEDEETMNLTDEQKELLRKIVDVYNAGCHSEFIVSVAHGRPPELTYDSGHPNVMVDVDTADFHQLASEQLITLRQLPGGMLRGKPTASGISTATTNFTPTRGGAVGMQPPARQVGRKIFIGHGRSGVWKDLKEFLSERLGLEWEEFNREPAAGRSTKEQLERMLDGAQFAFLVMTAEDNHPDGTWHARENVIHETGLFQGRLGFDKAIILLEEGCAEFSNIHGLTHIRFL